MERKYASIVHLLYRYYLYTCWNKCSNKYQKKHKVLGMGWPGGQNVRTPWESVFMLSSGPQLPYTEKKQNYMKNR